MQRKSQMFTRNNIRRTINIDNTHINQYIDCTTLAFISFKACC